MHQSDMQLVWNAFTWFGYDLFDLMVVYAETEDYMSVAHMTMVDYCNSNAILLNRQRFSRVLSEAPQNA